MLAAAVLSGFVLALAAPWLHRAARPSSGWILALLPAALAVYFASLLPAAIAGRPARAALPWVPELGIRLSFLADGLALLFAVLIAGIGAIVFIYAGGYLRGRPDLGRFHAFLALFMASMLGLVLADNLIALFLFWELTSVGSYLLIGFHHEDEEARRSAWQALIVTVAGGQALLAAFLLLAAAGGGLELSALLGRGDAVRAHGLYLPILLLVLFGAFTKSAQVPFHFWLPAAMVAPTPVSAYLHAATMVKAGVYLLARLSPVLGGTAVWTASLTAIGAATMVAGAAVAVGERDLKRVLAYTTVSALGVLVLLVGIGTPHALEAAVVFLLAHALYKGALFLTAGAVEHETGTRDVARLGGLRHAMPITAAAALLAALSMAGAPPLVGFLAKELVYEATLAAPATAAALAAAAFAGFALLVAAAFIAGIRPFFGPAGAAALPPGEAPAALWAGPLLLAAAGLLLGLAPLRLAQPMVAAAAGAMAGRPLEFELALWPGWSPALLLGAASLAAGWLLFLRRATAARALRHLAVRRWGPARWYDLADRALNAAARAQTRLLQSGYLRRYMAATLATVVLLGGYALLVRGHVPGPLLWNDLLPHEAALAVLLVAAAAAAILLRSFLAAVAALGVVGLGEALVYALFGAPDLAMAQVMVQTLTVVLFVVVLYPLPRHAPRSGRTARGADAVLALAAGALMTAFLLLARRVDIREPISPFFAEWSAPAAHGRNVVNMILLDFRALDTLGEIIVLGVAGIGVLSLLAVPVGRRGGT